MESSDIVTVFLKTMWSDLFCGSFFWQGKVPYTLGYRALYFEQIVS